MAISKERSEKIVNDMVDVLGPAAIIEYCGNTNFFMAELLKANGAALEEISGHLALQYFFMEVIKKEFGVDEELLELETHKCYINMEKILDDAKKNNFKVTVPNEGTSQDVGGQPDISALMEGIRYSNTAQSDTVVSGNISEVEPAARLPFKVEALLNGTKIVSENTVEDTEAAVQAAQIEPNVEG